MEINKIDTTTHQVFAFLFKSRNRFPNPAEYEEFLLKHCLNFDSYTYKLRSKLTITIKIT